MVVLRFLLRSILIGVATLFILIVASCEKAKIHIEPTNLDYQNPFGFSWLIFDQEGERIGDHWAECRKLIAQLSGLIAPNKSEHFVKECAQGKYTIVFVPHDLLSSSLRQGSLHVVLRGESEPVLYNYSFLHRVLPNDDRENKIQRRQHASAFRKELNNIYGLPLAVGIIIKVARRDLLLMTPKNHHANFG